MFWYQHEKFYLFMKFEKNLIWWVDWLGQLTENDPSAKHVVEPGVANKLITEC